MNRRRGDTVKGEKGTTGREGEAERLEREKGRDGEREKGKRGGNGEGETR